jgi:hypothetical protein
LIYVLIDFFILVNLLFLNPMKIESNKFYFLLIFLFGIMNVFAGPGSKPPPAPPPNARGASTQGITPPPGLSIDENSCILMIIALLFGIYIIYRHYIKTKATI